MSRIHVEFDMEIPEASDEHIEEWLRFTLHDNSVMYDGNILGDAGLDLEPVFGTFAWRRLL